MTRRHLLFAYGISLAVLAALPLAAHAVDWIPIVQCGAEGQNACTPCDVFSTIKNLIDLVLYGVTGPIAAFMIVFSGGMMLASGFNNPKLYAQGLKQIKNTLIGVAIILLSWAGVNFIIKSLGPTNPANSWYEFSCPADLEAISRIQENFSTAPFNPPPKIAPEEVESMAGSIVTALQGQIGVPVVGDAHPDQLCPTTCASGNSGRCINYKKYTDKYASGIITSEFLQSITAHESSCGRNKHGSTAGAFGPTQLLVNTARQFARECTQKKTDKNGNEITVPVTEVEINPGWLMSEVNEDAVFCITAAYLKSLIGACGNDLRNLAAGYNAGAKWCKQSADCKGMTSCAGGPVLAWECPWDNVFHTKLNKDRVSGSLAETRKYAPDVAACAK